MNDKIKSKKPIRHKPTTNTLRKPHTIALFVLLVCWFCFYSVRLLFFLLLFSLFRVIAAGMLCILIGCICLHGWCIDTMQINTDKSYLCMRHMPIFSFRRFRLSFSFRYSKFIVFFQLQELLRILICSEEIRAVCNQWQSEGTYTIVVVVEISCRGSLMIFQLFHLKRRLRPKHIYHQNWLFFSYIFVSSTKLFVLWMHWPIPRFIELDKFVDYFYCNIAQNSYAPLFKCISSILI